VKKNPAVATVSIPENDRRRGPIAVFMAVRVLQNPFLKNNEKIRLTWDGPGNRARAVWMNSEVPFLLYSKTKVF
jgi:hypothetical protein